MRDRPRTGSGRLADHVQLRLGVVPVDGVGDRLADLEAAVGTGNVRLLGRRGATARVETTARATAVATAPEPDEPPEPDDL